MPNAYYTPAGPANLEALFPALDFNLISEYTVDVQSSTGVVLMTTPVMVPIALCDDEVHLHFRSYPGGVDSQIFKIQEVLHDTKSDSFEKPTAYPLVQANHGVNRINVKANDIYKVSANYREEDTAYVDEVMDTTMAWLEVAGGYMPIVILDKQSIKRKIEERFSYEVFIDFKLSHDRIIIRP